MPKKIDIEIQRRLVAEAAIVVIGDSGLEGARLRDVALAAGLTTGAVTHYFDGKEAVLEAALAEVVRRTLARIEANGSAVKRDDAESFMRRMCSYLPVDRDGCREWRVWLAFWGRAVADARLRAQHQQYYFAFVRQMTQSLKGLIPAQGSFDYRVMADAVIAAIDGVGTRATLAPEDWPARRQQKTLRELLRPLLNNRLE